MSNSTDPHAPYVIVSADSIALSIASSVACTVAATRRLICALDSMATRATPVSAEARGLAVERATKMSPARFSPRPT